MLPDPLDEFATEQGMLVTRLPPTPRAALAGRGFAAKERKPGRPVVVVRLQVPMSRRGAMFAAAGLATSGLAILFGAFLLVTRDRGPAPPPFLSPSPSPIEIEYPDYPGTPALRTASTAVPRPLVAEPVPVLLDPAPIALATASPFDVRSAMPQLVAASAGDAGTATRLDDSRPADAPPRRIGPPLALTTLGGTVTRNGRLALVLDVTEQGDVSRVVTNEAVDVHPDVIDSVAASARDWRYEPARREGVPVPSRVRVMVQLNGTQ